MSASTAVMPTQIGRFRLRSMLGRGAMGVVYLGHDEEIDRLVAIKLIRADLLDTEERDSYIKRFRNEAKIAGRCMHANIVGLYDYAMYEGNPYLVMEYVNGVGLQQFFPRGSRRPVDEVTHIALQVLDALHYAHHRSIVHRDIKPANILMSSDQSLKITDFGISRLTSMELTATPLLIGTPSYMSPEQCIGAALDGRNDLFSLGCVLYELIAGERAFSSVNYTETIFAIVNKPHAPLAQFRDDLPAGFAEAIDKALAKKPEERFADAASFARTLDEIARSAGISRASLPAVIIETRRPVTVPDAGRIETGPPTLGDAAPGTVVAPLPVEAVSPVDPVAPVSPEEPRVEEGFDGPPTLGERPATIAGQDAKSDEPDTDATLIRPLPPISVEPHEAARDAGPPAVRAAADGPAPLLPFLPSTVIPPAPAAAQAVSARAPVATVRAATAVPASLDDTERSRIAGCLAEVLGPIAPLLVRRTEKPGMSGRALADGLAGFVRHSDERSRFLDLVGRRG